MKINQNQIARGGASHEVRAFRRRAQQGPGCCDSLVINRSRDLRVAAIVEEILRVLKPGGRLMVVAENYKGARNDAVLGSVM